MDQFPYPIVTLRLVIRQAIRTDMRGWSAMFRSPKARQHLNGPLIRTAQEWWRLQQYRLADTTQTLSIVLPETNELVGVCGFFKTDQFDQLEVWLLLRSKFWRKGMGAEVTSALVDVAFNSFAAKRVIAKINPANFASLNMFQKLGFVFMGEYLAESSWQNGHHMYGVERATH